MKSPSDDYNQPNDNTIQNNANSSITTKFNDFYEIDSFTHDYEANIFFNSFETKIKKYFIYLALITGINLTILVFFLVSGIIAVENISSNYDKVVNIINSIQGYTNIIGSESDFELLYTRLTKLVNIACDSIGC